MNNTRASTSNNHVRIGVIAMALVTNTGVATTADSSSIRIVPCFFTYEGLNTCTSEEGEVITNTLPIPRTAIPSVTVQDVIIQAQNILGIGKLHLASVFKMSRQNLDNLIKNNEQKPTPETETRALQVKEALGVISNICPYKLGASTMTCKINGLRLLDTLNQDNINLTEVRAFSHEIAKRIQANHQSNLPERVINNQEFMDTFNSI